MATAISAIVLVLVVSFGFWLVLSELSAMRERMESLARLYGTDLAKIAADTSGTADEVVQIAEVLKAASVINRTRQTNSVFDNDKIQEKPASLRYVPIARRRQQAEMASIGPQTHQDQVRENNARAIETAG